MTARDVVDSIARGLAARDVLAGSPQERADAALVVGLWTLATFAIDAFESLPALAMVGPAGESRDSILWQVGFSACAPLNVEHFEPARIAAAVVSAPGTLIVRNADAPAAAVRDVVRAGVRRARSRVVIGPGQTGNAFGARLLGTSRPPAWLGRGDVLHVFLALPGTPAPRRELLREARGRERAAAAAMHVGRRLRLVYEALCLGELVDAFTGLRAVAIAADSHSNDGLCAAVNRFARRERGGQW